MSGSSSGVQDLAVDRAFVAAVVAVSVAYFVGFCGIPLGVLLWRCYTKLMRCLRRRAVARFSDSMEPLTPGTTIETPVLHPLSGSSSQIFSSTPSLRPPTSPFRKSGRSPIRLSSPAITAKPPSHPPLSAAAAIAATSAGGVLRENVRPSYGSFSSHKGASSLSMSNSSISGSKHPRYLNLKSDGESSNDVDLDIDTDTSDTDCDMEKATGLPGESEAVKLSEINPSNNAKDPQNVLLPRSSVGTTASLNNALIFALIFTGSVRVGGFLSAFDENARGPLSTDVLDIGPTLFYFSTLSLFLFKALESETSVPGFGDLRRRIKILVLGNLLYYCSFFVVFCADCFVSDKHQPQMEKGVQTAFCILLSVISFFYAIALSLCAILKYFLLLRKRSTLSWAVFYCILVAIGVGVLSCLYRCALLLLPDHFFQSANDTDPGRYQFVELYTSSGYEKSLSWIILYYCGSEVIPGISLMCGYILLPSSKMSLLYYYYEEEMPEDEVRNLLGDAVTQIPFKELENVHQIGTGTSHIHVAKWRGLDVCVKMITSKNKNLNDPLLLAFCDEINIVSRLSHSNICQVLAATISPVSLITEYFPKGTLREVLEKESISLPYRIRLGKEIALAMNYLHCNNPQILHCDLTSENVLISDEYHAKVTDFGLAKTKLAQSVSKRDKYKSSIELGSVGYTAPEVLLGGEFTPKSDVFSYGMCLWELATQQGVPFQGMDPVQILTHVTHGITLHLPQDTTKFVADLIRSCWQLAPTPRPSFEVIIGIFEHNSAEFEQSVLNAPTLTPAASKFLSTI
ncbi:protein kinase superfamily protein [Pelomyxa schiedti]|nr:protein kinase superfamily protein [Pelomyxa schiedti]